MATDNLWVAPCLDRLATERGSPIYLRFDQAVRSSPLPWRTGGLSAGKTTS